MRQKRTIFGNRRINGYVTLPQYFETPNGKELWEYLKTNKPMVMIFLTRGGYVVDVQYKKFIDIKNGVGMDIEEIKASPPEPVDAEVEFTKPKEINPLFERKQDPIEEILNEGRETEADDDDGESIRVGDTVKWKDGNVTFINKITEVNEHGQYVRLEGVSQEVMFYQLISIVK